MINQVIPFMEFCVENDPFGESVQASVGDSPACFVNLFDHTGTDLVLKPLSLTSCLTRWSEMSMPCFKFASYCRSFDVGPYDAFVLRISGHMLGSQLKKCLSPFRMGVGFLLCTASRLADSAALKARFVTKFMNSFDNRFCGNSQKRTQRPYRATIGPVTYHAIKSLLSRSLSLIRSVFSSSVKYTGDFFFTSVMFCFSITNIRRNLQLFVV